MKKMMLTIAGAALALGTAAPAAATRGVELAMAHYATSVAGADAAAVAKAKKDHHAEHQARGRRDCDDCGDCCQDGKCSDCAAKKEECSDALCNPSALKAVRGSPCEKAGHG